MRHIDPSIYTKEYYLHDCCGSEEFKKNAGGVLHQSVSFVVKHIELKPGMKVLDVGCGRGDIVVYYAQKGIEAYGIDYAKAGIVIANEVKEKQKKEIQKYIHFSLMNAKKLDFPDNFFDAIISIDVFEHLYKEELEVALSEIRRVLKNDGTLLVNTEPNKIYLDFWHRYYVYPVSTMLVTLSNLFTKSAYPGIPKDPRNDLHKQQHVNEPTYFYLKDLFKRHTFSGKIIENIALLKPILSWKDTLYNIVVVWYPLSFFPPFSYLFAYDYICIMKKKI